MAPIKKLILQFLTFSKNGLRMTKRTASVLMLVIGIISAILFIVFRTQIPKYQAVILKVIPTLMMCFWMITIKLDKSNWLIFAGLVFSMIGDIFMELNGSEFFIIGIIANTIGIIFYTLYFYFSDKSFDIVRLIPVVIVMGVFYFILYDYLGTLKIPVLIYCMIHTLFIWRSSARLGEKDISKVSQYICFIGCVSLTISDFLLSLTVFNVLPNKEKYGTLDMILWWSGLTMLMITAEIRRKRIQKIKSQK